MGILRRTGNAAGDYARYSITGVLAVVSTITLFLNWYVVSLILIIGTLFNTFLCITSMDNYEDSKGRFKRLKTMLPVTSVIMALLSIWGIFKYSQLYDLEPASGLESVAYALAGGRGKIPMYGFIATTLASVALCIWSVAATKKALKYVRSGQRKVDKSIEKYQTKAAIRNAKAANGLGVAGAIGTAASTVSSSVNAVQTAQTQIAQNTLANAQTQLALEDTKIDMQRAKNQRKVVKAAGTGMIAGATAGALSAGANAGVSVGSSAGAYEASLMQQRLTGQSADYSSHAKVSEAQVRAAASVGFDIVRDKAAKMGIPVNGLSDEEVAANVLEFASPTQLADIPDGLSDTEKAIRVMCG